MRTARPARATAPSGVTGSGAPSGVLGATAPSGIVRAGAPSATAGPAGDTWS